MGVVKYNCGAVENNKLSSLRYLGPQSRVQLNVLPEVRGKLTKMGCAIPLQLVYPFVYFFMIRCFVSLAFV